VLKILQNFLFFSKKQGIIIFDLFQERSASTKRPGQRDPGALDGGMIMNKEVKIKNRKNTSKTSKVKAQNEQSKKRKASLNKAKSKKQDKIKPAMNSEGMNFESLANNIAYINEQLVTQAVKAVNISLTIRNWLIGYYIREYELGGSDRAAYGEKLLEKLAEWLHHHGMKRTDERELRRYRQLYLIYPQIREALSPELLKLFPKLLTDNKIRESVTPELATPSVVIVEKLSFTHLAELMQLDDPLKRSFYEIECIQGNWSVRELKRQIDTLYYERSSLSKNKRKLSKIVQSQSQTISSTQIIRDPYVFEFLGIEAKEIIEESKLEDSLLDKLQEFLLELGRGFCFEARQKRILIGDEYFFVDLVFYHRILKCHVLIELKVDSFHHEYLGQLNTYVNWFRVNEMTEGDNKPIDILLCTKKNQALVEYALACIDNQLFVSKYQLALPNKEEICQF